MHSTTFFSLLPFLAAAFATEASSSEFTPSSIMIKNSCSYPVYLWSVGDSVSEMETLDAKTGTWSEQCYSKIGGGGISVKLSAHPYLDATTQTVRGAVQYLSRNGAKVGLTGFCLGGAVTIIGACKIPELAAAVAFYGIPPEQAAKPADIRVPLQGHFANRDDWCTPAVVDAFEQGLKAAGKDAEIFRYDADHAFVNEQRAEVHDLDAAKLAWSRATAFFKKHLA